MKIICKFYKINSGKKKYHKLLFFIKEKFIILVYIYINVYIIYKNEKKKTKTKIKIKTTRQNRKDKYVREHLMQTLTRVS